MSTGTGSNFLDDFLNIGTQVGTGGLVGFSNDGFKAGKTSEVLIEGTKEITGANAAEEANRIAQEQFENDRARLEKQRADDVRASEQRQVSLSKGATKARGNSLSNSGSTSSTNKQTDMLGL